MTPAQLRKLAEFLEASPKAFVSSVSVGVRPSSHGPFSATAAVGLTIVSERDDWRRLRPLLTEILTEGRGTASLLSGVALEGLAKR